MVLDSGAAVVVVDVASVSDAVDGEGVVDEDVVVVDDLSATDDWLMIACLRISFDVL